MTTADPRRLRQGASRSVRRVSAVALERCSGRARPAAVRRASRAASTPARSAATLDRPRPAAGRAADLLRGDLSRRRVADGPAARPHAQRHQRRLVRRHAGALPAFRPGPVARDRGGTAAGARREYRHLARSIRSRYGRIVAPALGTEGVLDARFAARALAHTSYRDSVGGIALADLHACVHWLNRASFRFIRRRADLPASAGRVVRLKQNNGSRVAAGQGADTA